MDSSVSTLLQGLLGSRFEVRREIGSGGFGQVFEVFDSHLESTVAAKVLRPELLGEEGSTERFLREIRLLAELRHPNIIPILDVFRSEHLIAYLMPLVVGPTLRQRLDAGGAFALDDALRVIAEVGGALDFAHRRGVIHRDLKPENILLSDGHAVLADFGIARTFAGADGVGLTETGVVVGSPRYMSPEQISGHDRLDARSDLYALAAIGYELIAGHSPVEADSTDSMLRQKLLAAPTSLQIIRASVPPALDRAILRGLVVNPADRQATVGEFVRECGQAMRNPDAEPTPATPSTISPPVASPSPVVSVAPRKRLAWAAGAALLVLGSVLAWSWAARPRTDETTARSRGERAWFVIAEVETTPHDAATASAARSLIESRFEQSKGMGVLTREEIAGVLRSAGKPEDSPITVGLAREIAIRARASGVLSTSIRRGGRTGVLVFRAIDVLRDSVVASITGTFDSESSVLREVGRALSTLERELVPQMPVMASLVNIGSTRATTVVTTDLRAVQLLEQGRRAAVRWDDREAAILMREALARDSTFAWAWNGLGNAHANLGHRDSAAAALERALQYPDKFPPQIRWSVEAQLHAVSSDPESNLRLTERYATRNPAHWAAANNLALALSAVGRHREAIALMQRALRTFNPPGDYMRGNLTEYWLRVGETDSAEVTANAIVEPAIRNSAFLGVAVARGDGGAIDVAARDLLTSPGSDPSARVEAHAALAGRAANRGQVGAAWSRLGDSAMEANRSGESVLMNRSYWRQALMILAFGPMPGPVPRSPDRSGSLDSRISAGIEALLDGQPKQARAIAIELESRFAARPRMLEGAPSLLRAWAASLEQRPLEVVREASLVLAGATPESYLTIRKPAARWLLAHALEDLSRPDSAAFHYRAALTRTDLDSWELPTVPLIELAARQRLVIALARAGNIDAARAERERLASRVDQPDAISARGMEEVDLVLGMSARKEPLARETGR